MNTLLSSYERGFRKGNPERLINSSQEPPQSQDTIQQLVITAQNSFQIICKIFAEDKEKLPCHHNFASTNPSMLMMVMMIVKVALFKE